MIKYLVVFFIISTDIVFATSLKEQFTTDLKSDEKCIARARVVSCMPVNTVRMNIQRPGRFNELKISILQPSSSGLCSQKEIESVIYPCNRFTKKNNCFLKYGVVPDCPPNNIDLEVYLYKSEKRIFLADYELIKQGSK